MIIIKNNYEENKFMFVTKCENIQIFSCIYSNDIIHILE